MEKFIKNITGELLTASVLPHRCRLCGQTVKPLKTVCEMCESETVKTQKPFCSVCGCSMKKCMCTRTEHLYDGVRSPFVYTGAVKHGIHFWKFGNNFDATQFFASSMAEFVKDEIENTGFDYITFVPQTEKEEADRGYNQSELLAKVFAVYFDTVATPLLKKVFETKRQRRLPALVRSGNVLGAFDLIDKEKVCGKKIILIDDIKTTGSVLNECAKMLLIYGAESVLCVCIAVVEKENGKGE